MRKQIYKNIQEGHKLTNENVEMDKSPGVLSFVLLVECICLWIYCDDTLGRVEVAFEEIQITDISYEEEISSSGGDGYRLYLTIKNEDSKRELASV